MKSMQQLIKIPEVAATMRDLSKEMMKVYCINCLYKFRFIKKFFVFFQAGIIEEMLEDTFEGLED